MKNEDGKVIYRGSFATDYKIDAYNVEKIVQAGRSRWKAENENNNTLKTGGYALEHNFGHGKNGLSQGCKLKNTKIKINIFLRKIS